MSLESKFAKGRDSNEVHGAEIERYEKEHGWLQLIADRSDRLGRIALVALSFQALFASELPRDAKGETVPERGQIESFESTGTVELANGEKVVVPSASKNFNNVKLYLPKGERPAKIVLLFKQIHDLPKENLRKLAPDTRQDFLRDLMTSQHAIYDELNHMVGNGTISKVCSESLLDNDNMNDFKSYYSDSLPVIAGNVVAKYLPDSDVGRIIKRRD